MSQQQEENESSALNEVEFYEANSEYLEVLASQSIIEDNLVPINMVNTA